MRNKSFFLLIPLSLLVAVCVGCGKQGPSAVQKTGASSSATTSAQPKIREDIQFQISVDTQTSTRPLVKFPGYKKKMPGTPQVRSRFGLVVRDSSKKITYQRLLNDDDVRKGGVRDLNISPGKYSVALESLHLDDGQIVQFSNRVDFELENFESVLLPGKDLSRLRLPEGMSRFWRSYNTEMVPLDKVDDVLQQARQFEELDVHKSYYYSAIPIVKTKAAIAYCRDGQKEKAYELLREVREKGLLPFDLMKNSGFDLSLIHISEPTRPY